MVTGRFNADDQPNSTAVSYMFYNPAPGILCTSPSSGATFIHSNTGGVHSGSNSYQIVSTATGDYAVITAQYGYSIRDTAIQGYFTISAYPSSGLLSLCTIYTNTASYGCVVSVDSLGALVTQDTNNVDIFHSSNSIFPLNTPVRCDVFAHSGNTNSNSQIKVKISTGDAIIPLYSADTGFTYNLNNENMILSYFGKLPNTPYGTLYMDDIAISYDSPDFLAPAAVGMGFIG